MIAINSGLITYFACSFRDKPQFGKSGSSAGFWDLRKKRGFEEIRPRGYAMHDGAGVWGSVFWEMRGLLGKNVADQRLFSTWSEWKPVGATNQSPVFAKKLLEIIGSRDGKAQAANVRKILEERGLRTERSEKTN
jgi:hypothetical protein